MAKEQRPKNLEGYKSLKKLAKDIANLSYNSVYIFLLCLEAEMLRASAKDKEKGRLKLAKKLSLVAKNLNSAGKEMGEVWDICEKYTLETEVPMKKKGLSARKIQEICQSEGITLEEYYRREQDDMVPESEKNRQQRDREEKAEKRLEKTLKH